MSLKALLEEHAPGRPSVVTVGTFDGVHKGHQKILRRAVEIARSSESPAAAVAIMFRRPPRSVLAPGARISYLCSPATRERLIRSVGIDAVIPVDFDESVRTITPGELAVMLSGSLRMRDYVSGPGSAVGKDRAGNTETMRELGSKMGFTVHTVPPEIYNGEDVSSTHVRAALAGGRMGEVAGMLGRRYTFTGTVGHGEERGRTIGFPTANLVADDDEYPPALPADGIYATWARLEDEALVMAATSIGVRPTFEEDGPRMVEAFLLDFEENLYDRSLTLEFVRRLRPERKFDGADDLAAHMKIDVENTREILSADRSPSAAR